jgi:hypothetical protein
MRGLLASAALGLAVALAAPAQAATVYKWVDEQGTVHLSSDKPPAGVKYERITVASSSSKPAAKSSSGNGATSRAPAATPAQVAERSSVLSSLRNRECVIALEALDRLTSGAQATTAAEIKRLQQTVESNCSADPARRREQEAMAAKLRVANSPDCVRARDLLADMMVPGAKFPREQVRSQQEFVDEHCVPPVR